MLSINLFNPNQARINFGFGIVFDNGASTNQGSYKGSIVSGEGKPVGNVVNNVVCIDGVKSTDDYLKGLGKNIAITAILNHSAIMQLPESDRNIDYIVGFPPTQTIKNYASMIANLKDETGESLRCINYNDLLGKGYISENLDKEVTSKSKSERTYLDIEPNRTNNADIIKVSKDCKLVVTNDMVGGISYVANVLLSDPKYKNLMEEGASFVYIATGGGMGVAFADMDRDGIIKIKASECGHTKEPDRDFSLEAGGASSPALIKNFAQNLGLNQEQVDKVAASRNGKIVTDFKTAQTELKKLVDYNLSESSYYLASKDAINRYMDDIAYFCHGKVLEGVNFVVLAGPVVNGIKEYIKQNNSEDNQTTFDDILTKKIYDNLLEDMAKDQFKSNKFRVISDISVPDNTLGGRFLPNGQFIGENRGNWFEISKEHLLN